MFEIIKDSSYKELGAAFMFGLTLGYSLKKSFKLLLLVIILGIGLIFWFNGKVNSIDSSLTLNSFDTISNIFNYIVDIISNRVSKFSSIGFVSMLIGFLVGLKLG